MVDAKAYYKRFEQIAREKGGEVRLGDCAEVIKTSARPDDLESRLDFELEISFLAPDDELHANILEHVEDLLEEHDVQVYQDTAKKKCQMGGSFVRGDVVTWRADGRVFVSISHSTVKMNGAKPATLALKTYRGTWSPSDKRCTNLYLKATDFVLRKQQAESDLKYIFQRRANRETFTAIVPKNNVAPEIKKISDEMVGARLLCIEARIELDELEKKRKQVQQKLASAEDNLRTLHETQVKLTATQLEGKKRQKLDYEAQLLKKKAAIEKARRDYEELKLELESAMSTVNSEIDNLATLETLTKQIPSPEQQREAAIVDAVATAELPSMSSDDSNDSIAEHRNRERNM